MKGERDWSLIAKKAWETRRKNQGKTGEVRSKKVRRETEKLSDEDRMMMRIFSDDYVVGDEWIDKFEREMAKKLRRKELIERALGVHRESGICFGGNERKVKIERWSGGVRFASEEES